jgi:hypothetical protein
MENGTKPLLAQLKGFVDILFLDKIVFVKVHSFYILDQSSFDIDYSMIVVCNH